MAIHYRICRLRLGDFILDGGAILFSECGVQFFLSRKGRKYDVFPFSVFSLCVHHGKVDLQRAIYAYCSPLRHLLSL
jgi:hypothetical protein